MCPKIIDCFTFYNELDLLTYRLNVLNDVVDYFIIVEATHTHTGKEKILYFNENKHIFEKFKEKIIHIIVDDLPYKYPNIDINDMQQWSNENFQRNAISRGLERVDILNDKDLIIISDLDEIPDARTLCNIKCGDIIVDINTLEMDLYYYNLNTRIIYKWDKCKIVSYNKYKELNITCNNVRHLNTKIILNGGWHLSFFGDSNFIKNKLNNFAHQEYNKDNYTDLSKIEERVKNLSDIIDRTYVSIERIDIKDNNYLPIEYDKYLTKFYI
jgi:beta-1,4-mannosyl-glycoprotein beta-1,4-N-acetylglucosaminyltransferase